MSIHSMTRAGRDVLLIELRPTDTDFPAVTAGAHIDVHLGPVVRQYSLLGDPATPAAGSSPSDARTPDAAGLR